METDTKGCDLIFMDAGDCTFARWTEITPAGTTQNEAVCSGGHTWAHTDTGVPVGMITSIWLWSSYFDRFPRRALSYMSK